MKNVEDLEITSQMGSESRWTINATYFLHKVCCIVLTVFITRSIMFTFRHTLLMQNILHSIDICWII